MKSLFNFNNSEKKNVYVDEQGKYNQSLGHIRGNAATGEQVHTVRNYQTDKPMTFDEMEARWDEMNQEAKEWLDKNPGGCVDFITSQDINGNEIVRVVPTKDPIFSGSNLVALFNADGNKIVGKENIIREVQRRRAQQEKWIKEGKVENVFSETHHTDDGWTSNVTFKAYPSKLHPNEVKAESERLIGLATDKRKKQLGIKDSQGFSERISEVSTDDETSNKKPRTEEKGNTTPMDVDQPNVSSSPIETNFKLLSDDEIEKADKGQLEELKKRIEAEIEIREKIEADSSSSSQKGSYSIKELRDNLSKAENRIKTFNLTSNDDTPNNSGVGGALAVVGVVSAFAFGGVALVKSKFSKKK